MGDFSFLDSQPPLQRDSNRQQQQQQQPAHAAPGSSNAAGDSQQQQQQQQRARIQLPSFRQVQAAEAPSKPVNAFRPAASSTQQQQPQQQQQQQRPAWLLQQQTPAASGAAAANTNIAAPPPQLAAAAAAAAAGQQQPSWMASLPSMTLNTQLPRFSQTAGGASVGSAVGIARPSVPLPQSAAAAAAAAGGGLGNQTAGVQQQAGSMAGAAAGHSASQPPPALPQQQQVPINAVLVSRRQQGNPVLKAIKSVRWVFADIVPDYLCGQNTAVLFLSLRYHLLQPEYVLSRLLALQRAYRLTVLLLLVDAEEVVKPLLELHKATLGAHAVLVCAWSNEECARYIETFKAYENRPASSIMEHTDTDYMGRLASSLTTIRGVNRSDAYSLARHFGSLADVFMCEDVQGFATIPGLGPVKAKRLFDTFNQPFKRTAGSTALANTAGTAAAAASSQHMPSQQQQQQQLGGEPDLDQEMEEELNLLDMIEGRADQQGGASGGGGGVGADASGAAVEGAVEGGAGVGADSADLLAGVQGEDEGAEGEQGGAGDLLEGDGEDDVGLGEERLGSFEEDYLEGFDYLYDAEEF